MESTAELIQLIGMRTVRKPPVKAAWTVLARSRDVGWEGHLLVSTKPMMDTIVDVAGREAEDRPRRRAWSAEEKQQIVAETFEPGSSVSIVARRHDLNANMLFTWRRQARAAERSAAADVTFVPALISTPPVSAVSPEPADPSGRMEIVLPGGDRVIVGADVDAAALGRVIKVLSRR